MPTYKEMREIFDKVDKEYKEREKKWDKIRLEELEKKGIKPIDPSQFPKERCDHPNTMEDSTATVLWIVVMLVGSIFKGNWAIWIIATVLWAKFITRYDK